MLRWYTISRTWANSIQWGCCISTGIFIMRHKWDHLISIMGISILVRIYFIFIELPHWFVSHCFWKDSEPVNLQMMNWGVFYDHCSILGFAASNIIFCDMTGHKYANLWMTQVSKEYFSCADIIIASSHNALSNWLWCHQQKINTANETWNWIVKIVFLIIICGIITSCKNW